MDENLLVGDRFIGILRKENLFGKSWDGRAVPMCHVGMRNRVFGGLLRVKLSLP